MTPPHPKKKAKIVCECLGVTEAEVVSAIDREKLATVKQVSACTDAGSGCTACHPAIREYLQRAAKARAAVEAAGGHVPHAHDASGVPHHR